MWYFVLIGVVFGIVILAFAAVYAIGIYKKMTCGKCDSEASLEGKIAIVTGGTAGMGLEIATEFARRGGKIIIACPFDEEGHGARNYITQTTHNENVLFKHLDLSSLKSVHDFAEDIMGTEHRLDILMNNAGVLMPYKLTSDGMNFVMQVNYFGHFLLTMLLLPLLIKTGKVSEPSRIINVSSSSHIFGKINFNQMHKEGDKKLLIYPTSKLCLAMFTIELSKRLTRVPVVVNTADPGFVATNLAGNGNIAKCLKLVYGNAFPSAREGAQTSLHVALDETIGELSGEYFAGCKLSRAGGSAYDEELSRKLWDETVQCVKLNSEEINRYFN